MNSLSKINTIWLILFYISFLILALYNGFNYFNKSVIESGFDYIDFKVKIGDDESWRWSDFQADSLLISLPKEKGVDLWWIRTKINLDKTLGPNEKYGLKVSTSGAHDLYFNGHYIGSNGITTGGPGSGIAKIYQFYVIPDSLATIGVHQIALRISSKGIYKLHYPEILPDEYGNLTRKPLILALFIHFLAGIFLFLFLYFIIQAPSSETKRQFLTFSFLCLGLLLLLVFEYLKFYYQYSYTFHVFRVELISYLTLFVAILLPIYLLFHYNFSKKRWLILIGLILLAFAFVLSPGYDERAYYFIFISFFSALAIVGRAIILEKERHYLIFTGVLCCSICLFIYFDLTLFLGFGIFSLIITFHYLNESIQEKKEYQASLLKAKRLEVELLKMKLQPHFLMNTLTSLIDIIEGDRHQAKAFVISLSKLFDIINEISSNVSIPLSKELDLCKEHLKIMSYRKNVQYSLITKSLNPSEQIPPAVLLTILENGLVHNKPIDHKMEFIVDFEETDTFKKYIVFSSGKTRHLNKEIEDGIGNRYIKARLNEFYQEGNWEFITQKEEPDGWFTKIKIAKNGAL